MFLLQYAKTCIAAAKAMDQCTKMFLSLSV